MESQIQSQVSGEHEDQADSRELITLGGGCFWCTEAVFAELKGVEKVESGYSGGMTDSPTYREVCSGNSGHAEVVQVTFDPQVVSLREILEVFFVVHDPTTKNRQGADIGTQYRSVVYYANEAQKTVVEQVIQELNASGVYPAPAVTELSPLRRFYKAEDYHQEYYQGNSEQPYCRAVITPKLDKFRKLFKEKVKSGR